MDTSFVIHNLQFYLLGFLVLIVAISIIAGLIINKKRRERIRQKAEESGYVFYPKEEPKLMCLLRDFPLLNIGYNRRARNMLYKQDNDITIVLFDYQFATGGGRYSQTYWQSVMCLRAEDAFFPSFSLSPETFLSGFRFIEKLAEKFGFKDIDFNENPGFSDGYILSGKNEPVVREFFNRRRLDFFAKHQKLNVQAQDNRMLFFRQGRIVKTDDFNDFINEGRRVFHCLRD